MIHTKETTEEMTLTQLDAALRAANVSVVVVSGTAVRWQMTVRIAGGADVVCEGESLSDAIAAVLNEVCS